jgi:hypothetical protein
MSVEVTIRYATTVDSLADGAIFRRRPFAIQSDLLRFADKELRSADA